MILFSPLYVGVGGTSGDPVSGTNIGDKRKSEDKKVKPDAQSSLSIGEPKQKHPRINQETSSDVVEILDDDGVGSIALRGVIRQDESEE